VASFEWTLDLAVSVKEASSPSRLSLPFRRNYCHLMICVAKMLVRVPLNPLQLNRVSKTLLLNPFKLSLARVDPSRLGGAHMSHSAGRSEEVVISTRRSRAG